MTLDVITPIFETRCLQSLNLPSCNTRILHTCVEINNVGDVTVFIPFPDITPIDRHSSFMSYACGLRFWQRHHS